MFDHNELAYLAMGARALAENAREEAKKPGWVGIRALHEAAAKGYEELALKVERIRAELLRGPIPVADPRPGKPALRLVCPPSASERSEDP